MSTSSLRKALEEELVAAPEDLATHAAYADLLAEEGDARGEFIQTQIALEDPDLPAHERAELSDRERQLWVTHHHRWLGEMAPELLDADNVRFTFWRGWLDTLQIDNLTLELARMLRDSPQTRLLRELTIASARDESEPRHDDQVPEEERYQRGFWPLVGASCLSNLRVFRLGEDQGDDYGDYNCRVQTNAVAPLVRGMPRLEELYLYANGYNLTDLFTLPTLRNLRVLKAYHLEQVHRLDVLAANPAFRNLTHLMLHPHHLAWWRNREEDERAGFREAEGYLPLSVVKALLASPNLPHLTHLQLRVSSMGDAGCAAIVGSGVLKRLRFLDLRHGRITDEGAKALAGCPDARRLEWLDLRANALTDPGMSAVQALGIPCRLEDQHEPNEGGEEPSANEPYLSEGEFE